jgi:hypothetical protein
LACDLLEVHVALPPEIAAAPRWLRSAVLRQWGIPGSIYPRLAQRPFEQRAPGGRALLAAAGTRWPPAIEATAACNWPLRSSPWPVLQAALFAYRSARFAVRVTAGTRTFSATLSS